jgi:MoaA/NifB/PqqE/SkfB family radical SAM enzyme
MNIHQIQYKTILSFPISLKIISAGLTLLTNVIQGKMFNSRVARGPLFVTWLTTYDCNINCSFCSTHQMKKRFPADLTQHKALSIAHEIGQSGSWVVGFTGGEVLLWPYLFDVIKVLKEYNIIVYIVTNGLLIREKADQILNAGVDSVVVSIDDIEAHLHDWVRGKKGLYDAAMEGVAYLKNKRKAQKPVLKSTTVFSQLNYSKFSDIIQKLSSIFDVTSFQPISSGYANGPHNFEKNKEDLFFNQKEEPRVRMSLEKLIRTYPAFQNNYFKKINEFLFSPELLLRVKCWSPFLRLQILPNGEVLHCSANQKIGTVGNLNESSFLNVWNSPAMKSQRELIRQCQNQCICWTQDTSFNALFDDIPLLNRFPVFSKKD